MKPNYQSTPRKWRGAKTLAIAAIVGIATFAGSTMVGAIQLPSDVASSRSGGASDSGSTDERAADYKLEQLRLGCAVRQNEEQSGVTCRWSSPNSDRASAVRLVRVQVGSSHGREVVYRSSNLEITEYLDAPVRPGHRYVYVVQAISHSGRVVGSSRPVAVAVPPIEPPAVEQMRLNCAQGELGSATERVHVGCEWSLPQQGVARTVTLWRSVDGGGRQIVASFAHPFESAYRDVVPAGSRSVVYAVIATDGDGRIVARSRPETVVLRETDIRSTDVVRTDPTPAKVAVTDAVPSDVVSTDVVPADIPQADIAPDEPSQTDVRADSRPHRDHSTSDVTRAEVAD